jgi:2-amino-4-hydroxy-6-hydroxymethyldihydropteridine diphosphokinase
MITASIGNAAGVSLEVMRVAYIGMGGNVASWAGRPEETLARAARRLAGLGRVRRLSSLYSTAPVGYIAQPRFVNAAVALETELEPRALLMGLQGIEREFGRDRSAGIVNGPRTLDLDILLLDEMRINEPDLVVPHPRLAERAFALMPLAEIAPEAHVPICGRSVRELLIEWRKKNSGAVEAAFRIERVYWSADGVQKAAAAAGRIVE